MTSILISSCNTTKFLAPSEELLVDNKVVFSDSSKVVDKLSLRSSLLQIIEQKPNSRYFGIKREWLFIKASQREDDFLLKNWLINRGEEPVIYDSISSDISVQNLQNYLFNRGYFDNVVSLEKEVKNKKVYAEYTIDAKDPYTIDELNYLSSDPGIVRLLDSLEATSILKIGDVVNDSKYQLEKARITRSFLNNGYADFYSNLISPLQIDTTNRQTLISLEIYPPPTQQRHTKKKVGKIDIYTDYDPGKKGLTYHDTTYNNIQFHTASEGPSVELPTILDKVFLKQGQTTSRTSVDNTYRGLGDLGVYKFVTISTQADTSQPDVVNYNIQLTKNKKYVFDTGLDLNYSTLQSEGFGRNLLGITGSATIENRNLFNKAMSLRTSAEVGAEVNLAQIDSFNTLSTNIETVLNIPKFMGFPGTMRFLSLMRVGPRKIISPKFYNDLINRAATQLSAQYQNVFVTDFYQYQQFNVSYGYEVPISNRKSYNIHTIGINYYRPDTLSKFGEITQNAEFIIRSFIGDRLFTGFLYRDFDFYYQSKVSARGNYWIANFNNEVSGLEIWAINSLYNSFTNKTGKFTLKLDKEIDFARFTTFDFQFRYYLQLPGNQSIVFRANPGVALTLDSLSVPFVKQFYVGGPQSVRAWQIREIGPGSDDISRQNRTNNSNQPFFSAGDFKLEFNIEYRFDLFWRFKSAFFLDVGNVWLIGSDNEEGNLDQDFLKELAVGTGVGLRLDLTYALLRLDFGYKLKNPYKTNGSYWFNEELKTIKGANFFDVVNLNLAIGYPF